MSSSMSSRAGFCGVLGGRVLKSKATNHDEVWQLGLQSAFLCGPTVLLGAVS